MAPPRDPATATVPTDDEATSRTTSPPDADADVFRALMQEPRFGDVLARVRAVFPAPICRRCTGRPFSRAAKGLDNEQKGRLVHAAWGGPVADDPTDCPWCEGHFTELDAFADLVRHAIRPYEFDTILLATRVHPDVQALERRVEAAVEGPLAEHYEPMKTELNRELAARVLPTLDAEGRFDRADVVVLLDPYFDTVTVTPGSLHLYARYRKYDRTIPQTRWPCRSCQGSGCMHCDDTGQRYERSVESLVNDVLLPSFGAPAGAFHGSGREDIDALMLGSGRPFVSEAKEPVLRRPRAVPLDANGRPKRPARKEDPVISYEQLEAHINHYARPAVEIEGLRASDKDEVVRIKEAALDKAYRAHVVTEAPVARDALERAIATVTSAPLQQRTPERVAHRRADKVRERSVRSVRIAAFGAHARAAHEPEDDTLPAASGDAATTTHFTLDIDAESGTYIKELVHGDEGRTVPSFAALLGVAMRVHALDVVGVGSA